MSGPSALMWIGTFAVSFGIWQDSIVAGVAAFSGVFVVA